jgi:hypothetical protein
VDEISALLRALSLKPSRRSNPRLPLRHSCLRPKPLTRLPSLPPPVTSPAELRVACSFFRTSHFGLAEDRSPLSTACCRGCSAGDETPHATELCIACRTGDESSDFPRILHPAARAAWRISDFYRTFHLPAWQEMLLQFTTQLPTEQRVGLVSLWMQVQNLTKSVEMCLYSRIPENNPEILCGAGVSKCKIRMDIGDCIKVGAFMASRSSLSRSLVPGKCPITDLFGTYKLKRKFHS